MRCGKSVSRPTNRAGRTNCFKSSFFIEGGFFYYGQIYLKYKVGLLKYIEEINKRRCVIIEEVTFYKIQSNTLADLSDAVRNLNEDDFNRNPASMTANINDISTALRTSINEQNILVEALKKALQYKTASAAGQLPTLTNPGVASDLIEGKQLIDQSGLIVTGTLQPQAQAEDLTTELTEQDRLIAALEEMVAYKASVNGSIDLTKEITAQNAKIMELSEILDTKSAESKQSVTVTINNSVGNSPVIYFTKAGEQQIAVSHSATIETQGGIIIVSNPSTSIEINGSDYYFTDRGSDRIYCFLTDGLTIKL